MGGTHHAEPVVLRSLSEHPSGCVSRLHPAMSLFGSDSGPASHRPRKSEPAAGAAGLILSVGANVRFGFPKPFVPCRGAPATAQVQGAHYQSGMELLRCRSAKSFGRRAGYDICDTVCIDRYLCARSDSRRTLINSMPPASSIRPMPDDSPARSIYHAQAPQPERSRIWRSPSAPPCPLMPPRSRG